MFVILHVQAPDFAPLLALALLRTPVHHDLLQTRRVVDLREPLEVVEEVRGVVLRGHPCAGLLLYEVPERFILPENGELLELLDRDLSAPAALRDLFALLRVPDEPEGIGLLHQKLHVLEYLPLNIPHVLLPHVLHQERRDYFSQLPHQRGLVVVRFVVYFVGGIFVVVVGVRG